MAASADTAESGDPVSQPDTENQYWKTRYSSWSALFLLVFPRSPFRQTRSVPPGKHRHRHSKSCPKDLFWHR